MNTLALVIVSVSPWVLATLWVARRAGWQILWSSDREVFPSQAAQLASFGADRSA